MSIRSYGTRAKSESIPYLSFRLTIIFVFSSTSSRNAYTDLCLEIGGGNPSDDSKEKAEILGIDRLDVYKQIAGCHCNMQMKRKESWPLWLSVPHRYLISINIIRESANAVNTAPDLYLANAFVAGIEDSLGDLELIQKGCSKDVISQWLEEGKTGHD